jgi:hypothetical protein
MQFALKSQPPQVYDDDGVTHIRMYESFTESVLKEYADLAFLSWDYAASITPIPEHALQIHELVLQRAKALLLAAARHHEKNGSLTKEDEAYLQAAFDFQKLFLLSLADRTGEFARSINIPYDMVRDFFRFHDPTDADSRAVFNSAMELWFEKYIREQEHAPYKGKVEELTIRFYQEYEELEKDSAQTTADPILEKTRYKASDEYDLARGYMPLEADPEDPYTIGFIGIGNSRMENEIINALKAKTKGYRFIGIDINRPATLLEDVEFHRMNMKNLGREMPGKFNRLYAIWSPYMDVLELEELLDTAESLALACLTQNPVKPSESKTKYPPTVLLDIHFPFGKHSYEETTKKFHQDNPTEPEGMMHKDFEREGKEPVGKRFFASDPVFIDWIFGLYGFDIENLPRDPKEIANLCQQASLDDSFIPQGPQHDLDKQAYYRTASGANRITYKLKGVRLNQSVESIMAIRNEIMKEMKQKATENSSSSRMPT